MNRSLLGRGAPFQSRLIRIVYLCWCAALVGCSTPAEVATAPTATARLGGAPATVPTRFPTTTLPATPTTSATTALPAPPATAVQMTATPAPATPTADNAQIAARSHIPILCYHHIRAWQRSDTAADKPYIMPVPKFIAQLDYLQTNGYTTISPDQLVAYLRTGAPVPPKPIILTFDDGDSNQWTVALPELRKRHFTAMFFIMTVTLDKANYLSSDQIKALDRMGMTIAAHTWDHHRVDRYSGEDWERQISTPTKRLAEIVGHPIRYFAYPFGLWNTEAFPHLQDAGFDAAFQLADKIDPHTPLYTIRRAIANSYWTLPQFVTAITTWF